MERDKVLSTSSKTFTLILLMYCEIIAFSFKTIVNTHNLTQSKGVDFCLFTNLNMSVK